jgi:hypothetical protein
MARGCGCEERFIHFAPSRTHANWISYQDGIRL